MIAGAILLQAAFTFDCVDGQLARYTRTFTKLGAWLDSIFDRTKEYAVFAGLAIGASQTGDDVWLLAGAALALQVLRHSIDFSYPQAEHQAMGAVRQPPLEQVHDVLRRDGPGRRTRPRRGRPPPPPRRRDRRRAARARRLRARRPLAARPLGQEDHRLPDRRALRRDLAHRRAVRRARDVHRAARLGRLRRDLHDRRPRAALARAPRAGRARPRARSPRPARSTPTATTARSRSRSGASASPPLPGLGARARRRRVAARGRRDHRRRRVVAARRRHARGAGRARGGVSSGRPLRDRLRWAVPPALRVAEYAGILWVAALAGGTAVPAAFALLLRDHVPPLRHRLPPAPPRRHAAALAQPRRRRLGRPPARGVRARPPRRRCRPASTSPPRCSAIVFVGEAIAGWATFERAPATGRVRGRGGGRGVIGMVLAAGAGRRLAPYTDTLPKTLVPVDGDRTILDIALANLKAAGLDDVAVVTGYAAGAVRGAQGGARAAPRRHARARLQRQGRDLEQRLLAVVRARAVRRGRAARQRRHRPPAERRGDAAGQPRPRHPARARRRQAARARRR